MERERPFSDSSSLEARWNSNYTDILYCLRQQFSWVVEQIQQTHVNGKKLRFTECKQWLDSVLIQKVYSV